MHGWRVPSAALVVFLYVRAAVMSAYLYQTYISGNAGNIRQQGGLNFEVFPQPVWSVISREWQPLLVAAWYVSLALCASFCIIV
jgi:hypothetical protein